MTDMIMEKLTVTLGCAKAIVPPLVPIAMFASSLVHEVINEQTLLPITVASGIGGACWYLNGRFTRIEMKQDSNAESLKRLEDIMSAKPCSTGDCNLPPRRNHK